MVYNQRPHTMPHVTGEERNQLMMISLESTIARDSFVRAIDSFVDAIDMKSFGFAHAECKEEGRPSYHPSVLMKLYLYGYRYGIRTSRKLEREAALNLEAMWLTSCQCPKYKTIANFRKNNSKGFRNVFRAFVKLLRDIELIDGQTIAIDSFKIRAQNSLKNNLNQSKIDRHIDYIDNKIADYQLQLDQCDLEEDQQELKAKIDIQNQRKDDYLDIQQQLKDSGNEQISLIDPDARAVVLHRNIVNVGYNIQASSDSKHKLLVEYGTGDVNDSHALSSVAIATKELLGVKGMDVLADKGYHTGEELKKCKEENIICYVSPKAPSTKDIGLYPITGFSYSKETDSYTCPAGETLTTNNFWYSHSARGNTSAYRFRRFTTPACKQCKLRQECTKGEYNGRCIDRSEYAEVIDENKERINNNPEYYKKRQQVTEHQFGTLKRQRGFTFTLMKGKEKVLGEVGLEFIAYNLSRSVTILGWGKFIKALTDKALTLILIKIRLILSHFKPSKPKNNFLYFIKTENLSPNIAFNIN